MTDVVLEFMQALFTQDPLQRPVRRRQGLAVERVELDGFCLFSGLVGALWRGFE